MLKKAREKNPYRLLVKLAFRVTGLGAGLKY